MMIIKQAPANVIRPRKPEVSPYPVCGKPVPTAVRVAVLAGGDAVPVERVAVPLGAVAVLVTVFWEMVAKTTGVAVTVGERVGVSVWVKVAVIADVCRA